MTWMKATMHHSVLKIPLQKVHFHKKSLMVEENICNMFTGLMLVLEILKNPWIQQDLGSNLVLAN